MRLQCKHIPEIPILKFLELHGGIGCNRFFGLDSEFNYRCIEQCMPLGTPEKLAVAKMGQLIKRGLAKGCLCGCRGDFDITDKGRSYLYEHKQ